MEKMKIKLIIIDIFDETFENIISEDSYFLTGNHIDLWRYSPAECSKKEICQVMSFVKWVKLWLIVC